MGEVRLFDSVTTTEEPGDQDYSESSESGHGAAATVVTRVIGVPQIKTGSRPTGSDDDFDFDGAGLDTWAPICGHFMWEDDRTAELLCQSMGYRRGALHSHTSSVTDTFTYSVDAYRLGRCLQSDQSLTTCTGGCNDYTDGGSGACENSPGVDCSAGEPVGIRIVCEDVQPMFLRLWLK